MRKKLLPLMLSAALLCSCSTAGGSSAQPRPDNSCSPTADGAFVSGEVSVAGDELLSAESSAHSRVFYEIFVGAFSDSDGDGIGDIRGIIQRFDYLNDGDPDSGLSLGVEGIWLTPIFESPSYHKYDVADYYAIDDDFGTMDDLKELISLCHERDVKLILDMPINHTSDRNAWFTEFCDARREGDTESEYYDLYSCSDSISMDGRVYSLISGTNEYFECNFSEDMPELNFDDPLALQLVTDAAQYYLKMGIDGFRFDAAKYIFLGEESRNIQFWQDYISELKKTNADIFTVGEVWAHDSVTDPYFSATNCFNFTMSQLTGNIAAAAKGGDVNSYTAYIEEYIDSIKAHNSAAMLIPFVANHDMDRAAGFLTVASGEMKMAANLYLLVPGAPFIYYGEEIGMKGSRGSANTDANRRLAMLWGDNDTVTDPEGSTYTSDKQINGTVADQLADADSLCNHYKRLIMIRRANPEIAMGEYTALRFEGTRLGGALSEYNGSSVAVLHNSTDEPITVDLAQYIPHRTIRATVGLGTAELSGSMLTLSGKTSVVLK